PQPSYAQRIATSASSTGDSVTDVAAPVSPTGGTPPPSAKPSTINAASAATLNAVEMFCSTAPRWVPRRFTPPTLATHAPPPPPNKRRPPPPQPRPRRQNTPPPRPPADRPPPAAANTPRR